MFSSKKNIMNKEESVHDRLCTGFTRGSDSSPRLRQYTGSSPMSQVYRPGKADILRRRPLSPCCDFRRTMRELLMSAAPLSSLVQLPPLTKTPLKICRIRRIYPNLHHFALAKMIKALDKAACICYIITVLIRLIQLIRTITQRKPEALSMYLGEIQIVFDGALPRQKHLK